MQEPQSSRPRQGAPGAAASEQIAEVGRGEEIELSVRAAEPESVLRVEPDLQEEADEPGALAERNEAWDPDGQLEEEAVRAEPTQADLSAGAPAGRFDEAGPAAPRAADTDRAHHGEQRPTEVRVARPLMMRAVRDRVRPELVGVAALVVLALICAGLVVAVVRKTQDDAAMAAREAAAYTPPPLPSAAPSTFGSGPIVAVVGDQTVPQPISEDAARTWPAVLASALQVEVVPIVSDGAGYTTAGPGGGTFVEAAAQIPADAAVVVFLGGAADAQKSSLSVATAATQAFAAAAQQAPDAEILAVGPLAVGDGDAMDTMDLRRSVQSAARIADIRWVDPIRAGWLPDVDDLADLPDSAQRTIAGRMEGLLDPRLD